MPTASSKTANSGPPINMPDLLHEPIKNMVCVLDKKLRNLEKRKLKLVETKKKAEDGSELNEDQKKALENLILVDNSLATVKEVHKTLGSVEQEYLKLVRKDQKRIKQEQKEQFETKTQETVSRTIQIQAILGELNEDVRPDFINATNGACELTEDELANLDSFYELINVTSETKKTNFSSRVTEVAMHIFCVIEAKDKLAFDNVTYKELNEVLTRIQDCGYFDKAEEVIEEEPEVVEDDKEEEEEEFASLEGEEEEEIAVETEPNDLYTEDSPREDFSPTEIEPISEPYLEQPIAEEIQLEILDAPIIPMEETNGVDLPPEVQQTQQTPDNEKIDFMGESEISPAMLESQQQSLNPVSPEFIPRNMQPVTEDNGWSETPSAPATTTTNDSGWTETPSGDNEWQAVPDFNQNNGGGFRGGRGRGGGGRGFNARGRGGRGGGGGGGGGFRGGRQDGNNYRDGGNYRGGNRGGRGGRGGDGVRGGPRGRRGGDGYRGGDRGGRGGFGGGFNNRSTPQ